MPVPIFSEKRQGRNAEMRLRGGLSTLPSHPEKLVSDISDIIVIDGAGTYYLSFRTSHIALIISILQLPQT